MMIYSYFGCACKTKTKLKFKKPVLFSPTVVLFTCPVCDGEWMLKYSQPKKVAGAKPMELDVWMKMLKRGREIPSL